MLWLNHLVGYVCGAILLHEYKAFRYMHLAHHRDTNNEELDPDNWVAVQGPSRCSGAPSPSSTGTTSISGSTSPSTAGMLPLTIHIVVAYLILYGIAFWLSVFGWWREVLGAVDRAAHPCLGARHLLLRLSHPYSA